MSINEFLSFATAPGANVIEQEDYLTDPAQATGFTMGLLYSSKTNKVWRQSSFVAHCLSELMRETLDEDINDDGDAGTYIEQLRETIFRVAAGFEPIGDSPKDGFVYGRRNGAWARAVNILGDNMRGPLYLSRFPQLGMEAVNKQYVDNLVAGLAPIFSPVFTGIPRTPTPPHDATDDRIVNCAWVRDQIGDLVTGVSSVTAGRGLDSFGNQGDVTLWVKDYGVTNGMLAYMTARSVKANINYYDAPAADVLFTTFINELGLAPINSPHFIGIPTVPDPGDNYSNQIASTGWVDGRYLRLTGGTLYNPYRGDLLTIQVPGGNNNTIWFRGDRVWEFGAWADGYGGQFGIYHATSGQWNWLTYPNGMVWNISAKLWGSWNSPHPDFSYGFFADVVSTNGSIGFNTYLGNNTGGNWQRVYDGNSCLIQLDNWDAGSINFYTAYSWGGARSGIGWRHMGTIGLGRLRLVGDNSPSFYITNTVDGGSWGFRNSSSDWDFGRFDGEGNMTWNLARFESDDGSWHTYARQHAEGGMTIYGNDPLYIEGGNYNHARIYFANAGRVWLVGTRRDNGHWSVQDASDNYNEHFRVEPGGHVWNSTGIYTNGGFHTGSYCNFGQTDIDGYTHVKNNRLDVDGAGYFGGGVTIHNGLQVDGGAGVYNGFTIYDNNPMGSFDCRPFAYFKRGAQAYKDNDPFHVGENGTGLYSRIHYWSGSRHWLVGGQPDNNFAFYNAGGNYLCGYFNGNGDWMVYTMSAQHFYGAINLFSADLQDAPPNALQIVNSVRPVIADDPKRFRGILEDKERRAQFLDPDFVRRVRGIDLDALIPAMGEGFYYREERNGSRMVDYMELISVLWQSVQELSTKLDEVTSR